MNIKKFFKLEQLGTDVKSEVVAGVTTFLTMAYIIFLNSAIVSDTGMPYLALFATTIISTVVCTLFMSLVANLPFAVSTGMGLNASFTYMLCLGLGYHWKEGLAIIFISGILNVLICCSRISGKIVKAVPLSFSYAITAAIGMFISYTGIKNAQFIIFTASKESVSETAAGGYLINASLQPQISTNFSGEQIVGLISFFTILIFLALERKNKENYGAFLMGVLIATFIGISLHVTDVTNLKLFDLSSISEVPKVALSFFGNPGLLSIFASAQKAFTSIIMIGYFTLMFILNGYSSIIGTGRFDDKMLFDDEEYENFQNNVKGSSRLKKAIIVNSFGSVFSPLIGTTPATTFIESVTGVAAGGKSGLTSLVVAVLFLLCLPFAGILQLIPDTAIAPALIIAGCFLMACLKKVNWSDFPTALGCSTILLFVTLSYSIADGIMFGFIVYAFTSIVSKRHKEVHPLIYILCICYIILIFAQKWIV